MDTPSEETVLSTVYLECGSRWWYTRDLVADLGAHALGVPATAKNPVVSFGRWLGYRRGVELEGGWRVEADGPPNDPRGAVRWRVLPPP